MRNLLTITLSITLFASVLLADDGQMGSGGRGGCTGENCPPPPCTENCGRAVAQDEEKFAAAKKFVTRMYVEMARSYFLRF